MTFVEFKKILWTFKLVCRCAYNFVCRNGIVINNKWSVLFVLFKWGAPHQIKISTEQYLKIFSFSDFGLKKLGASYENGIIYDTKLIKNVSETIQVNLETLTVNRVNFPNENINRYTFASHIWQFLFIVTQKQTSWHCNTKFSQFTPTHLSKTITWRCIFRKTFPMESSTWTESSLVSLTAPSVANTESSLCLHRAPSNPSTPETRNAINPLP